jgi:hypothetical protein
MAFDRPEGNRTTEEMIRAGLQVLQNSGRLQFEASGADGLFGCDNRLTLVNDKQALTKLIVAISRILTMPCRLIGDALIYSSFLPRNVLECSETAPILVAVPNFEWRPLNGSSHSGHRA